ncbi:MAG TPA: twin-arginine translocation signal domain-containing protein, partial [Thermogutta sp.]|nr:twin-arginine translocation signal domain-containing protein [Thermogutta sp.]
MDTSLSRRMFLKSQAAVAAGAVAAGVLSAEETPPQGAPLRIGVIGVGGRGTYLLRLLLEQGAEVPAVCDIRPARLEIAGKLIAEMRDGQRPATYGDTPTDYRRMLERDDLEAVLIATPM